MKKAKEIAWVCLLVAGLLELVWAYFLKLSHGFSIFFPSLIALVVIIVSFFLLERAIRIFGIGMSYGIFTGIGIAGTTVVGIVALGEGLSLLKIASLLALTVGIIGLKICDEKQVSRKDKEGAKI